LRLAYIHTTIAATTLTALVTPDTKIIKCTGTLKATETANVVKIAVKTPMEKEVEPISLKLVRLDEDEI